MIVLSEGAKTDRMRLAVELAQISNAVQGMNLDVAVPAEDLSHFAQIMGGVDARDFANAYLFAERVVARAEQPEDILFSHQNLQIRCFSALELPEHVAVIEQYKALVRTASTSALELSQESSALFADPTMQAKLDAVAQNWSDVDTPERQQQAYDKIIEVLNVEWRSSADYNAYWIDRIVKSERVADMKEAGSRKGSASAGYMPRDLEEGIKAADIKIIASLWAFARKAETQKHQQLYLSDRGLIVLENVQHDSHLANVFSWPDMGFITEITAPVPSKPTPISPALNRMVLAMEEMTDLDVKLSPVFRGQSLTVAALLHPIKSWNVYFGYGALGASSTMLLGALKKVAVTAGAVMLAIFFFDLFEKIQALIAGDERLFQQALTVVMVVLTAILALGFIAYLPVFLGLWIGTVLRALGRSPINEFTNLQGTGKSNFITRPFGR